MTDNSNSTPEQVLRELESNAVWSIKYLDPTGFECSLFIDGPNGTEVLRKAHLAIERLKELKCVPVHQASTISKSILDNDRVSICPIHHVEMKLWKKGNRSWYAHRVDGKWCTGK